VALSVDGLNTINGQSGDARQGPKWVLDPYQSVTITGWQVDDRQARQFFFTNEEQSYAAKLGKTSNLGMISAAFFRERRPVVYRPYPPPRPPNPPRPPYPPYPYPPYPPYPYPIPLNGMESFPDSMGTLGGMGGGMGAGDAMGGGPGFAAGSSGSARSEASKSLIAPDSPRPSKPEYAATGMGGRVDHDVERVHMDLEDSPFETTDLRYEFRSALLKLGVLPSPPSIDRGDPLLRREKSKGYKDGEYCPEP